jgi:hypothetical protein
VLNPRKSNRSWGIPWIALTFSLALHIADEALNDFLSLWNPLVLQIREHFPWSPLPTFSFSVWLGGLIALVVALAALSPFALSGAHWLRPLGYLFAAIMFLNGLGHVAASAWLSSFAPGVYSSPLLLVSSAWLFNRLTQTGSPHRTAVTS